MRFLLVLLSVMFLMTGTASADTHYIWASEDVSVDNWGKFYQSYYYQCIDEPWYNDRVYSSTSQTGLPHVLELEMGTYTGGDPDSFTIRFKAQEAWGDCEMMVQVCNDFWGSTCISKPRFELTSSLTLYEHEFTTDPWGNSLVDEDIFDMRIKFLAWPVDTDGSGGSCQVLWLRNEVVD